MTVTSAPGLAARRSTYTPPDPLLTAAEGAAELNIAKSTFWDGVRDGRLPKPVYVARRCPRWRRSELLAAIAASTSAQ